MALTDVLADRTMLAAPEAEHLVRLATEWQLLADLSFSDLLLVCRSKKEGELVVVAQMRPYTAQTLYQEDQVGRTLEEAQAPFAGPALREGRIVREGDPVWREGTPVRVEAIPVRFKGNVIGVVSQRANLSAARTPSRLELTYLRTAGDLAQMIAEGTFPFAGVDPDPSRLPRVGDGLLRLDARGVVEYASPNATSAYRRLGVTENLLDHPLADFDPDARPVTEALLSRRPTESELERGGSIVLRRTLPLVVGGEVVGALLLLRDVTELRRRDRLLVLKDAMIKEIHHRVKNNLQTVASLLRLHSRRIDNPEAIKALRESERRIQSIAIVHESLSFERGDIVDFDQVARQVVAMLGEDLTGPGVDVSLEGSCGPVRAELAIPLAVVLTELLQNSVDHAFDERGGHVGVVLGRGDGRLDLEVRDDGRGFPKDFDFERSGLGLQIVRALIETELGGTLTFDGARGTRIRLSLPLERTQ
ncbi:MAG: sensor histidine kinase [Actinomycetota bacterium]